MNTAGGSACPVGVGAFAYTAKHVAKNEPNLYVDPLDSEHAHPVIVSWTDPDHDLAKVVPNGPNIGEKFPHPRPIAKHPPLSGETVVIYGHFVDSNDEIVPVVGYATALYFDPKFGLILDGGSWSGYSGGCICSLKTGEVYAILDGNLFEQYNQEKNPTPWGHRPVIWSTPIWGKK